MFETLETTIDEIHNAFPIDDKNPTFESRLGLTMEFFITFSRMEYALKEASFLSDKRNQDDRDKKKNRRAEADWDGFATDEAIKKGFEELIATNTAIKQAFDYYTDSNTLPKQQSVKDDGTIHWITGGITEHEQSLKKALTLVRRARNNLFHGSKFVTTADDPFRNQTLLTCGIKILKAVIPLNDKVREAYNYTLNEYHSG